jgi:4-hydroxybenzoate polyprenyltransferase
VALISFSLCASAIYIINDLIDLPADRAHRTKHRRPFASGALSISAGLAAASSLLMTSLLTALLLPSKFILVLGAYFVATTLYSFWLKRQIIVDVMLLAVLYTSRILAGSAATGIHPSFWLLAFSMFVFLCLAMLKRYSELRDVAQGSASIAGRGYMACDAPVILALGTGSGLVSVLVLALYTQSGLNAGAKTSEWLWLLPPLMLYWVARLWAKAGRGEVDDDPIVFAARDWQSLLVITLMAFAFLLSSEEWRPI